MGQKTNDIRTAYIIPANSTSLGDLDAVMYDADGRLAPCTASMLGNSRFAGFCCGPWSEQIACDKYGTTTAFSAPASFNSATGTARMGVLQEGNVVAVAITDTAGNRGDRVYLSTATSGAMTFTVSQPDPVNQVWVGTLEKTFTGAAANDEQRVIVRPCSVNTADADIQFWLNNHVVDGLLPAFDSDSKISYTSGGVFVQGRHHQVAAGTALDMAACASHATLARIALVVVGNGGTVRAIDTGGVKVTMTTYASGGTESTFAKNSHAWPTLSAGDGVPFGAVVFRSGSADIAASRVVIIRRSLKDTMFRRWITGNPYSSGTPGLR
jgi:hypothetical protein